MDDHGLDFDGGREERERLGFPFQAIIWILKSTLI